jgi:hypothetical protein
VTFGSARCFERLAVLAPVFRRRFSKRLAAASVRRQQFAP